MVAMMIIAAILAASTISRFSDESLFDQVTARDGLLSVSNAAQLASDAANNVSIEISLASGTVQFSAVIGSSTRASRVIPTSKTSVQVDAAAYGGTPNACTAITSPVSIAFHPSSGIESSYEQGFQVCLNNVASFCIAPSGFAYRGACVANGS
jgi:hypothetical protein